MNTKNFKLSTLAKAMLPILAASALSACGDDDSSYTAPTPGTSVPGEVELAPNVDLPAAAATPSANEVSLSYIADTTSNVARMSNTTTDFSQMDSGMWRQILYCDIFGSIWSNLVSRGQRGNRKL